MLPRIDALRYSSMGAVGLVVAFMIVLLVDGMYKLTSGNIDWGKINWGPSSFEDVFLSIPIMSFAFVCHMNVFPVVAELKDPSKKRTDLVSKYSMLVCLVIYSIGGSFGFFAFEGNAKSDVIESYEDLESKKDSSGSIFVPSVVVKVMQIGIALALTFSFPVVAFELRHSAEQLIFGHAEASHTDGINWKLHTALNVSIVFIATLLAIVVPDIRTVFGFTGSTMSCFVVFILPAYFYIRLSRQSWGVSWRGNAAYIQMIVGILLVPIGLAVQIWKVVQTDT
eukprot:gb/GECG01016598.1/.p1 GENE.gb/GECG01016598.1/~~gb/GECG01016598.1/.p1  ORF type:complete len:281 (+),score=20.96 gb/GECG01016598.1/:1-843(+)